MSGALKWSARIGTALAVAVWAVLVPAVAWASSSGVGTLAGELVRRRPRMGGFALMSGLCCLLVVALVVLTVLLIARGRGRRR